jgi:hypothetical protein
MERGTKMNIFFNPFAEELENERIRGKKKIKIQIFLDSVV